MKLIFRSVKDELTRLINKAHEEGKIVERVELNSEEFSALISEYERAASKENARREGKVFYLGTLVVNTEHRPSEDNWSLFMSINTDDNTALQFEENQYCIYLPNLNRQFKGNLDYLRKTINKMAIPKGWKYETQLRTHLASLRVAIETGEPFHVRESGNQDIEITLEKLERA